VVFGVQPKFTCNLAVAGEHVDGPTLLLDGI
jgi:hypothetical protein